MMKKVVMFGLAAILIMIAIASLGPIVGLAISLVIAYFAFKQFLKTDTTLGKLFWGLIVLVCLGSMFGNIPGVAGVVAIAILYIGYKKWTESEEKHSVVDDDPFTNFERQWEELNKYHI